MLQQAHQNPEGYPCKSMGSTVTSCSGLAAHMLLNALALWFVSWAWQGWFVSTKYLFPPLTGAKWSSHTTCFSLYSSLSRLITSVLPQLDIQPLSSAHTTKPSWSHFNSSWSTMFAKLDMWRNSFRVRTWGAREMWPDFPPECSDLLMNSKDL